MYEAWQHFFTSKYIVFVVTFKKLKQQQEILLKPRNRKLNTKRMDSSKSKPSYEIGQLMKEQLELLKTEKELQGLIDKINSQLNQLLVRLKN